MSPEAVERPAAPDLLVEDTLAPEFIRQAERAASWNQPRVRAALSAGVAALGLALVMQVALLFRDGLAARWPGSRPALDSACVWAGCTVEPLRRIAALAVDSSGLNQYEGTTVYRLSLVLHNRGDVDVMLPALDLVLTNPQGAVVARRVLQTAELGSSSRVLAAGAELALQASLNTGERRVSGYTIEIFYP